MECSWPDQHSIPKDVSPAASFAYGIRILIPQSPSSSSSPLLTFRCVEVQPQGFASFDLAALPKSCFLQSLCSFKPSTLRGVSIIRIKIIGQIRRGEKYRYGR